MAKQETATKKAPAKRGTKKVEGKEFVISIRMTPGKDWGRAMRMKEVGRIMRDSSLHMDVWSHVVDLSVKQMEKLLAANTVMEDLRAERVKLVQQLVERSREVYGDKGKADRWMQRPSPYLGNQAPVDMLGSMAGIAEVMTELERIDASAFA